MPRSGCWCLKKQFALIVMMPLIALVNSNTKVLTLLKSLSEKNYFIFFRLEMLASAKTFSRTLSRAFQVSLFLCFFCWIYYIILRLGPGLNLIWFSFIFSFSSALGYSAAAPPWIPSLKMPFLIKKLYPIQKNPFTPKLTHSVFLATQENQKF